MSTGYTYTISFYRKSKHLGWVTCNFRTTEDALKLHLSSLYKQQTSGKVRAISYDKVK